MRRQMIRLLGYYVETVVAMVVGMALLALPSRLIWPGLRDHPTPHALVMLASMAIGMAAWMAIRRHSRAMIVEMSAAMVAPFVILLAPLAAGAITAHTVTTAGHLLMFLTMLAAMLLRREHYTHHHGTAPLLNRRTARSFRWP